MGELDAERMERLPLYIGPAATVQIIAAQWMAQTGTVYPDLMGASRVKGKLQQAVAVCRSETLDVRMRRFAVSIGTAQDDAVRGAGNGPVYSQSPGGKPSFGYGQIIPVIGQMTMAESILDLGLLGNQAESGRIAVQPVHGMVRAALSRLLIVPGQRICQRSVMRSRRWMHQ